MGIWPPGAELLVSATLLGAVTVAGGVALAGRQGTTVPLHIMAAVAGIAGFGTKEVEGVGTVAFAAAHLVGHVRGHRQL